MGLRVWGLCTKEGSKGESTHFIFFVHPAVLSSAPCCRAVMVLFAGLHAALHKTAWTSQSKHMQHQGMPSRPRRPGTST